MASVVGTKMLSTIDNPFDPFTEFDAWFGYDYQHGYHTPGLLARIARVSDDLSAADITVALHQAMDEIVRENVSGMHTIVTKSEGSES